ncbi:MAG: matrixin family metalloprotease [Candidatus Bathyarchaeia archaeon]
MDKRVFTAFLMAFIIALASCSMIPLAFAKLDSSRPPDIEQVIFIHFAKGKAKPPSGETGYYKLIGAKWQNFPVHLEVNPDAHGQLKGNLTPVDIVYTIQLAAEEWDEGAYSGWGGLAPNLFNGSIALRQINVTITNKGYDDLAWTRDKLDGCNTIVWGDYPTEGVIAVTILWYNKATKTIIEFDIVLDTDYTWGDATQDSGVMDLQNIVTHELGHGIGLGDVYQSPAYQETMYGYSYAGETSKRDLYIGDKTGATKLYGAA